MSGPRHLWAGEYADSEHPHPRVPRLDGRTRATPPDAPQQAPGPPGPPPRVLSRPARLAATIAAIVVLAAGAGALAITLIDGGDEPSPALAEAGGGRVPEGTIGRVYAAAGPSVVAVQARQGGGIASGTGLRDRRRAARS